MNLEAHYEQTEVVNDLPLKVKRYQFSDKTDSKEVTKHWHRSIEWIIPEENGVEVWMEGNIFHIYPGTMLLVNSQNIHEFRPIHPSALTKGYTVKIKYDFFKQALPQFDYFQFETFYEKEKHEDLFLLMENIIRLGLLDLPYKSMKMNSYAYELCFDLVSHFCIENRDKCLLSRNKGRLTEIISYLDQHYQEMYDASAIADHFHLSYGHLAKCFKNELGMTISEYINSVRVRNASFDLLETSSSIIEISQKHGFVSPKAFYKEFEKVYHMTPKQYRKQL